MNYKISKIAINKKLIWCILKILFSNLFLLKYFLQQSRNNRFIRNSYFMSIDWQYYLIKSKLRNILFSHKNTSWYCWFLLLFFLFSNWLNDFLSFICNYFIQNISTYNIPNNYLIPILFKSHWCHFIPNITLIGMEIEFSCISR